MQCDREKGNRRKTAAGVTDAAIVKPGRAVMTKLGLLPPYARFKVYIQMINVGAGLASPLLATATSSTIAASAAAWQ